MQNYLTKKQIAKKLNTPASNISHYMDVYGEYMPEIKLDGQRHPVYEESAIEIIKKIISRIENGKNRHEIKRELESLYPINHTTNNNQAITTPTTTQQKDKWLRTTDLQQLTHVIRHHDKITQSAISSLDHYQKLLEAKENEIEKLQQRVEQLERENQEKNDQLDILRDKLKKAKKPSLLAKLIG